MVSRLELAKPSLQDHPPPNLSLIIRRVTVTLKEKEIMRVYCLQWEKLAKVMTSAKFVVMKV